MGFLLPNIIFVFLIVFPSSICSICFGQQFDPESSLPVKTVVFVNSNSFGKMLSDASKSYERLQDGMKKLKRAEHRLYPLGAWSYILQQRQDKWKFHLKMIPAMLLKNRNSNAKGNSGWSSLFPGQAFFALSELNRGEYSSLFGFQVNDGSKWEEALISNKIELDGDSQPWKIVGGKKIYRVNTDGLYFFCDKDWVFGSDSVSGISFLQSRLSETSRGEKTLQNNRLYQKVASREDFDVEVFVDHRGFARYSYKLLQSLFQVEGLNHYPVLDIGTGFHLSIDDNSNQLCRFQITRTLGVPLEPRNHFINRLKPLEFRQLPILLPKKTDWVFMIDDPEAKIFDAPKTFAEFRPGLNLRNISDIHSELKNRNGFARRKGLFILFCGEGAWWDFFGSLSWLKSVKFSGKTKQKKYPNKKDESAIGKKNILGFQILEKDQYGRTVSEVAIEDMLLTFVSRRYSYLRQRKPDGTMGEKPDVLKRVLGSVDIDNRRSSFIDFDWAKRKMAEFENCLVFEASKKEAPGANFIIPSLKRSQIWGAPLEDRKSGQPISKEKYISAYKIKKLSILSDFWFRFRLAIAAHSVIPFHSDTSKYVTYLFHRRTDKRAGKWIVNGYIRKVKD